MKTLKTIAALSLVAGGMMVAGLSNSADAGDCGYGGLSYGYNFHRPIVVAYPHVHILSDVHGLHYFTDGHGLRHDVYATAFNNRFFYNYGGHRQFVLGY